MYERNELTCIKQTVKLTDDIYDKITKQLNEIDYIYSYIVYKKYKDGEHVGWKIRYNISANSKFNTIDTELLPSKIVTCILNTINNDKIHVIGYEQPDLSLMLRLYNPLIKTLAKEQHDRWQFLEMEDLRQMCRLVICNLYYSKYYLHKHLIARCFNNYVLMHIRNNKDRPTILSLDQTFKSDDENMRIADIVSDNSMEIEQEEKDCKEIEDTILREMKEIIIDYIGPRQYDQLLREYKNKQTTIWSRKLMQQIKAHLFELGINKKSFTKYYG